MIAGGAAILGQTLLIREGLVLFSGNELVMGFLLCVWLSGTGLGSYAQTRFYPRTDGLAQFERLMWVLAAALCFSVMFFRLAPRWFGMPRGEVVPLGRIVIMALVGMLPASVLFGALFPIAARLQPAQKTYLFEGLGAGAGGILFSFILAPAVPSLAVLAVTAALLIAAWAVARPPAVRFMLCLIPMVTVWFSGPAELTLRRRQWGGENLAAIKETRYGVYGVYENEGQWDFYSNGMYDFSYPDLATAEEAVHYPLLLHPMPSRVLLVGGTLTGSGREIRRHPSVKTIVGAELDPSFYWWARSRLGSADGIEPISNMVFGDARRHIKNRRQEYDVIIINLPDPVNGQLNRYYTRDFFQEARQALAPGGVMSVRISASPDILSPAVAAYVRTVQSALQEAFGNAAALPASRIILAAFRSDTALCLDSLSAILNRRIAQRGLDTRYVTETYVRHGMTPEKAHYLETILEQAPGRVNQDLKPACYYYALTVWSGLNADWLRNLFVGASRLPRFALLLPLALVFAFFRRRTAVACAVFLNGMTALSLCLVAAVLFQVSYGYVYGWLALLTASFMTGLAAGAWLSQRRSGPTAPFALASWDLWGTALICGVAATAGLRLPGSQYYLPLLLVLTGLLSGLYFCIALAIRGPAYAGRLYAGDLAGAALAALAVTMFVIPLAGIMAILFALAFARLLMAAGLRLLAWPS